MSMIRPAHPGRAARRPSVTRGPDDVWLSAATCASGQPELIDASQTLPGVEGGSR